MINRPFSVAPDRILAVNEKEFRMFAAVWMVVRVCLVGCCVVLFCLPAKALFRFWPKSWAAVPCLVC